jgi:hypothetical protein
MHFAWVLVGFIGIVLVFTFMHVWTRMASERESLGRRKRAGLSPLASDTTTFTGHS